MIGDVTNREEKNQDAQQLQASLFQYLVSGFCAAEKNNHMSIAAQCDEEWDAKPSEGPSNAIVQVILNIDFTGGVVASNRLVSECFAVEHVWKTLNAHQQPNHDGDPHRVGDSYSSHHSHWMDNSQVPVHTDTSKEPNAAI